MADTSCVEFLQRLIRTESMPGDEGEIAEVVAAEMTSLGYDEVEVDEAGNVIGLVAGSGAAPSLMFNTHLDHVDVGDPAAWSHPPFAAEIAEGRVWGRGAVDIKGPLAAQVHGVGSVAADPEPPPGDLLVSCVVQEEVGGFGARYLAENRRADLVVIGEPSSNELRRGHRGRIELVAHVRGLSAHASAPERGVNPLTVIGRFLDRLADAELPSDDDLGRASVAATMIRTDQRSPNVIPGEVWLVCDCRTIAGQTAEAVRDLLLPLLEDALIAGAEAEIEIPTYERRSYTGLTRRLPADNPAHALPAGHPAILTASETLEPVLGRTPAVDLWRFATDGGHFALAGMTVVGFGPGDETLAHTVIESIPIEELEIAVDANAALARSWPLAYRTISVSAG